MMMMMIKMTMMWTMIMAMVLPLNDSDSDEEVEDEMIVMRKRIMILSKYNLKVWKYGRQYDYDDIDDEDDEDNDDNIDNDDKTWRFGNVADNMRWSSSSNGWPLYLNMTMVTVCSSFLKNLFDIVSTSHCNPWRFQHRLQCREQRDSQSCRSASSSSKRAPRSSCKTSVSHLIFNVHSCS